MKCYGDEKSKVYAVTVQYPGVAEWLRHGAEVGLWHLTVLGQEDAGKPIEVPDADTVLFGAWHPVYSHLLKHYRQELPNVRAIIAWSSSPGEMDQSQVEIAYVMGIKKALTSTLASERIDGVGCLHSGLVSLFGDKGFLLPAPVALPARFPRRVLWEERSGVAFYAPGTLKKNILTQLLATRYAQTELGERAKLFTNLESYAPALEGFEIDHVLEPWVDDVERHRERLTYRKVALCASFSESWCYGAVDALLANTPVVGSPTIPWLPEEWRVHDPNDPSAIVSQLTKHLTSPPDQEPRDVLWSVAQRQNKLAQEAVTTHVLQ